MLYSFRSKYIKYSPSSNTVVTAIAAIRYVISGGNNHPTNITVIYITISLNFMNIFSPPFSSMYTYTLGNNAIQLLNKSKEVIKLEVLFKDGKNL